jgi:hypothetical protein
VFRSAAGVVIDAQDLPHLVVYSVGDDAGPGGTTIDHQKLTSGPLRKPLGH